MSVLVADSEDTGPSPPWFPATLVDKVSDPSTFSDGVPSPWGRFHGWDFTVALSPEWWNTKSEGQWGEWPGDVQRVEVVNETRFGLVLQLDDA